MMNPNNPYNQQYMNYLNGYPTYRQRSRRSGCGLIGCLPILLVLAVLAAAYFYYSNHTLPHVPQFVIVALIALAFPVALVVFVLLFIRGRVQGKGFMASVKASFATLLVFAIVIAALILAAKLTFPEVDMTRTAFAQTNVDANTGAYVHFVNTSNGIEQILCIGTNGHCAGVGQDPNKLLGSGLRVEPGQTLTVVFPNSGDFPITSKTVPGMNMIIHVQDNSSDSGS
jgi:hypothetical protein